MSSARTWTTISNGKRHPETKRPWGATGCCG